MAMTTPVETRVDAMAFVLPRKNADSPPTPLETSAVEIEKVGARLVAAKPFGGLVTDDEIRSSPALRIHYYLMMS